MGVSYVIKRDVHAKIENIMEEEGSIMTLQNLNQGMNQIFFDTIQDHVNRWERTELLPDAPDNVLDTLNEKYGELIDDHVKHYLPHLSDTLYNQMKSIVLNFFVKYPKDFFYSETSGVVIAGFGTDDVFPVVESFSIDGKVCGFLKHKKNEDESDRISSLDIDAVILPFAQKNMVDTFMGGLGTYLGNFIFDAFKALTDQCPKALVQHPSVNSHDIPAELEQICRDILTNKVNEIIMAITDFRAEYYTAPIMKGVSMLSKDDLATLAESLVNLTSLRKRVSIEDETVSGPIDVAVISKGDGFIWIKRKQYFDRRLNEWFDY